jgi:hypothetical protein
MSPKRKRTSINNIPENVLEQIHNHVARRTPRNSAAFEAAFKRARRATPRARPNRITNGPKKLEYPPDYPLPGPAEVRELKQRLLFITKLLRALQTDVKNAGYETRLERYTAFKNTLQHILETNRSFDTITRRHLRTEYLLNNCSSVTTLRYFINFRTRDPCYESTILKIKSSRQVLPFTVTLETWSVDQEEYAIDFTHASISVDMGKWKWYILGREDRYMEDIKTVPVRLPMSVRRIRVNQQPGILQSRIGRNFNIRHQLDTIDLVRLIELVKRTDPFVQWKETPPVRTNPEVRHLLNTYARNSRPRVEPVFENNNSNNNTPYRRPGPYNSNSNSNTNNRRR